MIKLHCFQKEWLDGFREQNAYKRINPPLLEKMIHALSLLQYLQVHGLNQSAFFIWYKAIGSLKQLDAKE